MYSDTKPVRVSGGTVMRLRDPRAKNVFTQSGDTPHRAAMANTVLKEFRTDHKDYGHDVDTEGPYVP